MGLTHAQLIDAAKQMAHEQHAGQYRKYTGQPYTVHPAEVAELVATVTTDPAMRAAAWLHDVIEDTPATAADVAAACGEDVAQLVVELTDVSRPNDGNRATRKAIDRTRLAGVSARAQTIKLADLISNTYSIVDHDPGFARVYLAEKQALLDVLTHGDPHLYALARDTAAWGRAQLQAA